MPDLLSPPICISAPVRRSGTTLLQRLLCSSTNALVYGESCANDLQLFSNFMANKQYLFLASKNSRNQQLERVLEGDVNSWIPDLMPEIDGYVEAFKNSTYTLFNYYATYAQQQGRPIWGMKMPEWNPVNLAFVQKVIPGTKIIYLHRNLEDCVRSAKKIDMVSGLDEIRQFSTTWKQYSDYTQQHLNGPNVLHLSYERLIEYPEQNLKTIQEFSGIQHINEQIMKVKVNTYHDDPKLETEQHDYLEPESLSEEELAIVNSFSTATLEVIN